jgi:hypothetical protein
MVTKLQFDESHADWLREHGYLGNFSVQEAIDAQISEAKRLGIPLKTFMLYFEILERSLFGNFMLSKQNNGIGENEVNVGLVTAKYVNNNEVLDCPTGCGRVISANLIKVSHMIDQNTDSLRFFFDKSYLHLFEHGYISPDLNLLEIAVMGHLESTKHSAAKLENMLYVYFVDNLKDQKNIDYDVILGKLRYFSSKKDLPSRIIESMKSRDDSYFSTYGYRQLIELALVINNPQFNDAIFADMENRKHLSLTNRHKIVFQKILEGKEDELFSGYYFPNRQPTASKKDPLQIAESLCFEYIKHTPPKVVLENLHYFLNHSYLKISDVSHSYRNKLNRDLINFRRWGDAINLSSTYDDSLPRFCNWSSDLKTKYYETMSCFYAMEINAWRFVENMAKYAKTVHDTGNGFAIIICKDYWPVARELLNTKFASKITDAVAFIANTYPEVMANDAN